MNTLKKKIAGLIYGPEVHHLDHIAPICVLMNMPLILTEEEIADHARKYYPDLKVIFWDYLHVAQKLVESYAIIFCSMPRDLFDEIFLFSQKLSNKKIHTVWCPHGNSDKGSQTYFMEALQKEEIALIYGQKMVDILMKKNAFSQLKAYVATGNYRYLFFLRHQAFYCKILQDEVFKTLAKNQRTALFAPTWQDSENSSSFFSACPHLVENCPENWNLIIKPHPNLLSQDSIRCQKLFWEYEDRPNIRFLIDFPPVYALLKDCDIYIGDMSSIGYDFLRFDRPMFFLNQNERDPSTDEGLYLYRCGVEIKPSQYKEIWKIIDIHLPLDKLVFSEIRNQVYNYTFASGIKWEELASSIEKACTFFSSNELHFF